MNQQKYPRLQLRAVKELMDGKASERPKRCQSMIMAPSEVGRDQTLHIIIDTFLAFCWTASRSCYLGTRKTSCINGGFCGCSLLIDKTIASVIGLVILGFVGVVFAVRYRGKGKLTVKSAFGSLKAEGENPPLPSSVAAGVKVKDADAGGNLRARSEGGGGVELEKVKVKGDITATSSAVQKLPPKD
jgi:hypothetical protein